MSCAEKTGHGMTSWAQQVSAQSLLVLPLRLGRIGGPAAAHLNAVRDPSLHFLLEPANRPNANLDATRKSPFGFKLVDHRAAEARALADLRETQNMQELLRRNGIAAHGLILSNAV